MSGTMAVLLKWLSFFKRFVDIFFSKMVYKKRGTFILSCHEVDRSDATLIASSGLLQLKGGISTGCPTANKIILFSRMRFNLE